MRLETAVSKLRILAFIIIFCCLCPTCVIGQGYKLGTRNSPINEPGTKPCDYWDENDHIAADGTRTIKHYDGTVVIKQPNQPAIINRPPRSAEGNKLDKDLWIFRGKFKDSTDGGVLTLKSWDVSLPSSVVMYGDWILPDGTTGQITTATFDTEWHGDGRILMWLMYPHTQAYCSAVLYPSHDGNYLNGSYMYHGETGRWDLKWMQ